MDMTIFLAENYSMPFKKHQLQAKGYLGLWEGCFSKKVGASVHF